MGTIKFLPYTESWIQEHSQLYFTEIKLQDADYRVTVNKVLVKILREADLPNQSQFVIVIVCFGEDVDGGDILFVIIPGAGIWLAHC